VALEPEAHAAGASVDRCPSCLGVFASHEAMQRIDGASVTRRGGSKESPLELARRAAAPPTTAITCPACNGETTRREWRFSTFVMVDVCIECRGVWLDPGELEAIEGRPSTY
jgi:Zn-finger nucleic acid-binding protein